MIFLLLFISVLALTTICQLLCLVIWGFFLLLSFLIEIQLIYNVALVSIIQQSD